MTDIEALTARLQRLEDIEAARNMHHVYAEILEEPNAKTVGQLFADDGVLRTPMGDFVGRDDIEGFYAMAFEADTSVKQHLIVNPKVISAEPGLVRLQSYFLYLGRGDDASVIGWGTYDDLIDVSGPDPLFREKTIGIIVGTTLEAGWKKVVQ
ncbi:MULTISPECIES: nuclear transport factor 2 family protein [Nocardioides]|uniref:Nuclear transport factor 2 family protein n=1 Tax=Nocardioides vastitatis TaxID=2568655 RepID=A0ABW0ZMF0_9ACTN|nr:nuclear transport factor 2 family protein [Nocardioides sp.]THI96763.1 nuclear transport factor 2 family protein [Nocardioides sp.]